MPRGVYIHKRKEHRISQDGIEEKHCVNCDTWQPLKAYGKHKSQWDNLNAGCKTCKNANAEKRRRELTKEGRERIRAQCRKSQKKRRMNGKLRAYANKRYKEDAAFRTLTKMRARIKECFSKHGVKKNAKTSELMGCSPEFLNAHLEKYFTDDMSWENRNEWHIDHVVPCCAFGVTIEEQKILHWYENLMPMLAKENRSKSGTYKEEDKINLIKRYNEANNTNYLEAQILDKQQNCEQEQ
tara:strand:+ start:616 stop:1335 length:720 start_codon:yes stop_codon:yes gene_type:complete